jgi:DNA-binding response OmpR family regulator
MEKKKIVLVEDDADYRWILEQGFKAEESLVSLFAKDGEEGLAMIEKEKPDLVVLDLMLPKIDGVEVAKRAIQMGLKPKVIFLTNLKDLKHIMEAVAVVKETDYILKADAHIDQIVRRVKDRLGMK